MGFRENWIQFVHKAATGGKLTRMVLTPVGAAAFAGFTALFALAALFVDRLLGLPPVLSPGLRIVVSVFTLAAGLALAGGSGFHFLKVKGTPVPFNPPPKLVDTGPYRHVRNPMVTGLFLILPGLGFCLDSLSLVVFFTPLYIMFHVWEIKNIEEPELVKRLGKVYEEYRRKTPMFVPRFLGKRKMNGKKPGP